MSATTGRQFYHNNPHSPPRSPQPHSPLYPPTFNPAIRFGNNRLSTYSDVSIHDLSDFCEDELDDYLPQDSSSNLVPQNQQLDKLYGGILDSQQWNFTSKPKTDSVDYDFGEWSKTSAMILSDPPKRKYLLDTATVDEPTPPLPSKVPEPIYSEKPKQADDDVIGGDMSKAPSHAISFARSDFFSHQEKAAMAYGDQEEDGNKSFYKKNRVVIISASILLVVLAILLIVLGATGNLTPATKKNVVNSDGGSQAMSQHEGWEETKQVEEIADVAPGFWSGDHSQWVDDSTPFRLTMPNDATIAPPVESAPVASVEPAPPVVPASLPVIPGAAPITDPASSIVSAFSLSGEGEGTFYSPSVGLGACGNQNSDTELVAALNIPQFGAFINPSNSPACGACVNITGPKGSVQVKIVDKCPGCKQGDIDLSPAAFEKVADFDAGRVKITWTPC